MLIEKIKGINLDRLLEVDEAVELSAVARTLEQEYTNLELPVPGWLTQASDLLREEIAKRTRASDLARLKELEAQLESFKTVSEKKSEALRALAELQKKLGLTPAKAGK